MNDNQEYTVIQMCKLIKREEAILKPHPQRALCYTKCVAEPNAATTLCYSTVAKEVLEWGVSLNTAFHTLQ